MEGAGARGVGAVSARRRSRGAERWVDGAGSGAQRKEWAIARREGMAMPAWLPLLRAHRLGSGRRRYRQRAATDRLASTPTLWKEDGEGRKKTERKRMDGKGDDSGMVLIS
uniref:Uncharacterized protein n=1 Tax=Oryza meridionalis TaxID=40149 RepID=A0A0E0F5V1_9ORYZ